MDKILLKDAKFLTRVGVTRLERRKKQPVVLNVTACKNLRNVGSDLRKTLDYARLHSEIKKAIEGSEFTLLEEIAEKVANAVKGLGAASIVVRVHKPNAFKKNSAIASIEIERYSSPRK